MLTDYQKSRMEHINSGRPLPEKKLYKIPPVSARRASKIAEAKKQMKGEVFSKNEEFYQEMRLRLTGTCQCGCSYPSSRYSDTKFRACIAHIFPKKEFPSIAHHELNWVERALACHTNMDSLLTWNYFLSSFGSLISSGFS